MSANQTLQRRQSHLTRGRLPSYAVWVVLAASVVLGAALASLIGFSVVGWAIITAVVFVLAATLVTAVAEGERKAKDRLVTFLVYGAFLIALLPLVSVLWTVLERGVPGLSYNFLFTSMNGVTGAVDNEAVEGGTPVLGGAYHAVLGTLQITLWATLISVPIGLLTAVYLVEYGSGKGLTKAITFFVDVMTGIPSI